MTRQEFLSRVPATIKDPMHGYGEIEIVVDFSQKKGACYRHPQSGRASGGSYGATWREVYECLIEYLRIIQDIKK